MAVASLALGIGANSAIFALVDGVLLKSLPVRDPQRLILLDDGSWTNPIWEQIRARQLEISDGAAAWGDVRFDLSRAGATEFVEGLWTSGNLFESLCRPCSVARSRWLTTTAGRADGPVADRYVLAAPVGGKPASSDGAHTRRAPFTIVGVTGPRSTEPGRSFTSCRLHASDRAGPATRRRPFDVVAVDHGEVGFLVEQATGVARGSAADPPSHAPERAVPMLDLILNEV